MKKSTYRKFQTLIYEHRKLQKKKHIGAPCIWPSCVDNKRLPNILTYRGPSNMYSRGIKLIKLTFKSMDSAVHRTISYGSSPLFDLWRIILGPHSCVKITTFRLSNSFSEMEKQHLILFIQSPKLLFVIHYLLKLILCHLNNDDWFSSNNTRCRINYFFTSGCSN